MVLRHPEATRPWQHVLDCVAGYLAYLEALATRSGRAAGAQLRPEAGRPGGHASGELATLGVAGAWAPSPGGTSRIPTSLEAKALGHRRQPGARRRWASRAGWTRRQAVALTMDWYRRQAAGEDALALCLEQIEGYEGRP